MKVASLVSKLRPLTEVRMEPGVAGTKETGGKQVDKASTIVSLLTGNNYVSDGASPVQVEASVITMLAARANAEHPDQIESDFIIKSHAYDRTVDQINISGLLGSDKNGTDKKTTNGLAILSRESSRKLLAIPEVRELVARSTKADNLKFMFCNLFTKGRIKITNDMMYDDRYSTIVNSLAGCLMASYHLIMYINRSDEQSSGRRDIDDAMATLASITNTDVGIADIVKSAEILRDSDENYRQIVDSVIKGRYINHEGVEFSKAADESDEDAARRRLDEGYYVARAGGRYVSVGPNDVVLVDDNTVSISVDYFTRCMMWSNMYSRNSVRDSVLAKTADISVVEGGLASDPAKLYKLAESSYNLINDSSSGVMKDQIELLKNIIDISFSVSKDEDGNEIVKRPDTKPIQISQLAASAKRSLSALARFNANGKDLMLVCTDNSGAYDVLLYEVSGAAKLVAGYTVSSSDIVTTFEKYKEAIDFTDQTIDSSNEAAVAIADIYKYIYRGRKATVAVPVTSAQIAADMITSRYKSTVTYSDISEASTSGVGLDSYISMYYTAKNAGTSIKDISEADSIKSPAARDMFKICMSDSDLTYEQFCTKYLSHEVCDIIAAEADRLRGKGIKKIQTIPMLWQYDIGYVVESVVESIQGTVKANPAGVRGLYEHFMMSYIKGSKIKNKYIIDAMLFDQNLDKISLASDSSPANQSSAHSKVYKETLKTSPYIAAEDRDVSNIEAADEDKSIYNTFDLSSSTYKINGADLHKIMYHDKVVNKDGREFDGGYIESQDNIEDVKGAYILDGSCVLGKSRVEGGACVTDRSVISGNVKLATGSYVVNSKVSGNIIISGDTDIENATIDNPSGIMMYISDGASILGNDDFVVASSYMAYKAIVNNEDAICIGNQDGSKVITKDDVLPEDKAVIKLFGEATPAVKPAEAVVVEPVITAVAPDAQAPADKAEVSAEIVHDYGYKPVNTPQGGGPIIHGYREYIGESMDNGVDFGQYEWSSESIDSMRAILSDNIRFKRFSSYEKKVLSSDTDSTIVAKFVKMYPELDNKFAGLDLRRMMESLEENHTKWDTNLDSILSDIKYRELTDKPEGDVPSEGETAEIPPAASAFPQPSSELPPMPSSAPEQNEEPPAEEPAPSV